MQLIPGRDQWRRWSLPSRLTAIGALFGLVSVFGLLIQMILQVTTQQSDRPMENHPVGIDVPASGYSESVRYAMAKHARYSLGVHRGVISSPDKPQRSWDELDEEERASLVRFARTIEKGFRELGYKFEYVNPPVAWHPSEAEFNYLALRNYLWRSVEYTHGGGYKEWSELSPRSQQDFQEEVRETLDTLFDAGLSVVPIERDGM